MKTQLRIFAKSVVVSLFIGSTIALGQVLWTPDLRIPRGRTLSPKDFVRLAFRVHDADNIPSFRDLKIYPQITTVEGKPIQYVTGEIYTRQPRAAYTYEPFTLWADIPFLGTSAPTPSYTIIEFLNNAPTDAPKLAYTYAWWAVPSRVFAFWFGSCVLILGCLFPSIFIAFRSAATAFSSKGRGSGWSDELGSPATLAHGNGADIQIDTPSRPGPDHQTDNGTLSAETPVKVLTGVPPEVPADAKSDDHREYQGEYYPVELRHRSNEK